MLRSRQEQCPVTGTTTWNAALLVAPVFDWQQERKGWLLFVTAHSIMNGYWVENEDQVMPSNEYTDDHVCEHDNDRVVIAPTVRSSPCIAPAYPAHFSYCSLQLPPPKLHSNANPCPEHKGSLCEVFTYPHHHPPLRSHPRPGSLSQCGWCAPFAGWWTERDKAKVHTPFLFTWRGGRLDPAALLRGQLPCATAGCRPPSLLLCTTICPLI